MNFLCVSDSTSTTFVAKDKTVWNKTPQPNRQTPARNIVRQRAGPHRSTEMLTIADTFKKIMSIEIVDIIMRCTNKKAEAMYEDYNNKNPQKEPRIWKKVTVTEMYSFFGILICAGANNSNTDHVDEMWKKSSFPLYRATMGRRRFQSLLRFIRFDDHITRRIRAATDKAAPITDVWNMLNANLATMYRPTEHLTIDEQLFPYRGRTKFTQYMPSKPAKYGLKVFWVCDASNAYPLKGILYTGKQGNTREVNQGERVVKELVVAYKGSGRNISMDRFFTTLPLAKSLLSWNLTIVGTLKKKNKTYIPPEMKPSNSRELLSTLFGFHEQVTMCSYVPKKNKAVILLSTMHYDAMISDLAHQKPEMILFYNKTKAGVDTMDQMCMRYSTQRRTCRWPLAFFYNMLDIACVAAYVIYYENNNMLSNKSNRRRIFLRQLSEELAMPVIQERASNQQVMRNHATRLAVESYFEKPVAVVVPADNQRRDVTGRKVVVGSCYICNEQPIRKRRKTRKCCAECEKPVCDEHSVKINKCLHCDQ